ncbi:MAG: hypothetical protein H0X63_10990, partial [Flavobacteriales bacterium]|nr:hypothetical protein [Flavobacteriales bacterium]
VRTHQNAQSNCTGLGYLILDREFFNLQPDFLSWCFIIGMILMTIGEMISSPFSNSIALNIDSNGRKVINMGVFSMSFLLAHIIGHNTGKNLVDSFEFEITWYVTAFFLLLILTLILWLHKILKNRQLSTLAS